LAQIWRLHLSVKTSGHNLAAAAGSRPVDATCMYQWSPLVMLSIMHSLFSKVMYLQWGCTFSAGLALVLYQFGRRVPQLSVMAFDAFAFWPLAVLAAIIYPVLVLVLGAILQSSRMLILQKVLTLYSSLFGAAAEAGQGKEPAINADLYHMAVIFELVGEAAPGIGITLLNYYLLRTAGLQDSMSWTGWLSVGVSSYMVFRTGFKYLFTVCVEGKTLREMKIENDTEELTETGMAGAEAAVAVAPIARTLVTVATVA